MSDYLAILGRQPELSLVELESLLGAAAVVPFGSNTAVLSGAIDIDRLGGVIKTGVVIYRGPVAPVEVLPLDWEALRGERAGKLAFGLSYYGARATPRSVLATGLELKKQLKAAGPIRFIAPSAGGILSAAQLHHHRVLENGFELLVVVAGRELIVACTTGFQDIEAYSARDYGRPARSAKVGMLPPKLAQILVNTTHAATVVDPFCGTGVVLQEALLLGRPAIGSDAAAEMVAASRTNLEWLADQRALPSWAVSQTDAQTVVFPSDVAIVSEGYLGQPLSQVQSPAELERPRAELSAFYRVVLRHWATQLVAGAELSLCLPSWRVAGGWLDLPVVDELPDLGYTLKQFARADGRALRYARADQLVGRKILLLTRS